MWRNTGDNDNNPILFCTWKKHCVHLVTPSEVNRKRQAYLKALRTSLTNQLRALNAGCSLGSMQQTAQLLPTITLRAFIHASGVSNTSLYIFIESFFSFPSQVHWKLLAICLQEHSIALLTFSPVQFGGRGGQERAARNKSQSENEYRRFTRERIHKAPLYFFFHLQTTFSLSSCLMQWTSLIGSFLTRIHATLATCTKYQ